MDISISKTADGRCRKFIGGQWFPLHKDERVAKLQAMALQTQWEQVKETGTRVWPESVLANKQAFANRLVATASVASPPPTPTLPTIMPVAAVPPVVAPAHIPTAPFNPMPASPYDTLTLYEAFEHYKHHIKSRFQCNQIGDDHYYHQLFHLETLKELLPDQPLALVGRDLLTMVKQHFASRPISGKTGKPVSVEFVVNIIQTTHMLFDWLADFVVARMAGLHILHSCHRSLPPRKNRRHQFGARNCGHGGHQLWFWWLQVMPLGFECPQGHCLLRRAFR